MVRASGKERPLHLHCKLASGQQNEGLRSVYIVLLHHFDDGNEKAERLARACLCRGKNVAAFESGRNTAGLYRSRGYKIVSVEPSHKRG